MPTPPPPPPEFYFLNDHMTEIMANGEDLLLKLRIGHESVLLNQPLKRKSGEHTHRWTVFVRAHDGNSFDTKLINRVVFKLHPDFDNPKRGLKNTFNLGLMMGPGTFAPTKNINFQK